MPPRRARISTGRGHAGKALAVDTHFAAAHQGATTSCPDQIVRKELQMGPRRRSYSHSPTPSTSSLNTGRLQRCGVQNHSNSPPEPCDVERNPRAVPRPIRLSRVADDNLRSGRYPADIAGDGISDQRERGPHRDDDRSPRRSIPSTSPRVGDCSPGRGSTLVGDRSPGRSMPSTSPRNGHCSGKNILGASSWAGDRSPGRSYASVSKGSGNSSSRRDPGAKPYAWMAPEAADVKQVLRRVPTPQRCTTYTASEPWMQWSSTEDARKTPRSRSASLEMRPAGHPPKGDVRQNVKTLRRFRLSNWYSSQTEPPFLPGRFNGDRRTPRSQSPT